MASVTYITVQQFCVFHQCEEPLVNELIEHGIIELASSRERIALIPDTQVARLEKALRLRRELGVNAPGIDIILNLLERLPDNFGRGGALEEGEFVMVRE